jgi:hypothetical protein
MWRLYCLYVLLFGHIINGPQGHQRLEGPPGPQEKVMLYGEFLTGTDNEGNSHLESIQYAYEVINRLYMKDILATHEDCYEFYRRNRYDFQWIDELKIGPRGAKAENTCKKIISGDEAKDLINEQFAFERDKIEICGPAYYEATDWNFIRFMVKGYPRIYWNDSLYDIWR